MAIFKVQAELRDDSGKGASRRLRHQNLIPAIVYGAKKDPRSISVEHHKVLKFLEDEAFFTSILELSTAGGKKQKVILRDMQRHPAKPRIMHMDFLRVDDNEMLHMHIPLHFLNEDTCPASKIAGVVISHQMNDVEVACLPADLPEFIEINIENFDDGDMIRLSEIDLPKGVTLTAFTHGDVKEHDAVVLSTTHVGTTSSEDESDEDASEEEAEAETTDES